MRGIVDIVENGTGGGEWVASQRTGGRSQVQLARMALWQRLFTLLCRRAETKTIGHSWVEWETWNDVSN